MICTLFVRRITNNCNFKGLGSNLLWLVGLRVNKKKTHPKTRYCRLNTKGEEETKDNRDPIGLMLFKTWVGNLMKNMTLNTTSS